MPESGFPAFMAGEERCWPGTGDGIENGRPDDDDRGHGDLDLTDIADVRVEDVNRCRQDLDSPSGKSTKSGT
jgi:hypothetical protein